MSRSDEEALTAVADLRSADPERRQRGVERAVEGGERSLAYVQPLLSDADDDVRAQAMYALSRIASPASTALFLAGLGDADERVRAFAAVGLAELGHDQALPAALRTLDDAPDELHLDQTPAVRTLIAMGERAVPGILEAMLSEDDVTRLHAQRALEGIVYRRHGFLPGAGFPSAEAEEAARGEWRHHGDYAHDASPADRDAAVRAWRDRFGTSP